MNQLEIDTLREIRENLKEAHQDFPKGFCSAASEEVHKRLGYKIIYGRFVLGDKPLHYWNETHDKKIVDLTADQFSPEFPSIMIIDIGSSLAKSHYQNYFEVDAALLQ